MSDKGSVGATRGSPEETETLWQRVSWWWTWRVWRPLRRRCSWCDFRMIPEDEYDALDCGDRRCDDVSTRHSYLGFGAWACYGCCEYGEG